MRREMPGLIVRTYAGQTEIFQDDEDRGEQTIVLPLGELETVIEWLMEA